MSVGLIGGEVKLDLDYELDVCGRRRHERHHDRPRSIRRNPGHR